MVIVEVEAVGRGAKLARDGQVTVRGRQANGSLRTHRAHPRLWQKFSDREAKKIRTRWTNSVWKMAALTVADLIAMNACGAESEPRTSFSVLCPVHSSHSDIDRPLHSLRLGSFH